MKYGPRLGQTLFVLAALVALAATSVEAQITFFGEDTDGNENTRSTLVNSVEAENDFLSSLIGVGTENFEAFSTGDNASDIGSLSFPGAGSATLSGGGEIATVSSGTNGVGRYPISGDNFWETSAGTNAFSIAFTDPIAAFGFYGVDIGDFGGTLTLNFLSGGSSIDNLAVPHEVGSGGGEFGGSAFYFGYINSTNPFDEVNFELTTEDEDFFAFDDMTIGSVEQVQVPEPASMALLAGGLLSLLGLARRREEEETG